MLFYGLGWKLVKNNFFDHAPFGVGDLELEKTIFSEFGMKIEKNNFLTTPTFYADDLDLEKTIFSEFGMKIEKNNFFCPAHFFSRWPWPWLQHISCITNVVHPFRYRRIDLYSRQRVRMHGKRNWNFELGPKSTVRDNRTFSAATAARGLRFSEFFRRSFLRSATLVTLIYNSTHVTVSILQQKTFSDFFPQK